MKSFIVVFCVVSVALAAETGDKGHKHGQPEGPPRSAKGGGMPKCNATRPEGVSQGDCCPDKPRSLTCLSGKECFQECNGGEKGKGKFPDICCMSSCTFKNYSSDGKINAESVISALSSQVKNNTDAWSGAIATIVNFCIQDAPNQVQKMKDELAAAAATNQTGEGNKPCFFKAKIVNCSNAEQIVTEDCIKRKLFLDCPTRVTSDSCNALYQYAQACPAFFYEHGKGKRGSGEGNSHERSGEGKGAGRAGSKSEKQTERRGGKEHEQEKDNKGQGKQAQGKNQKQAEAKNQGKPADNKNQGKPADNKNQKQQQQQRN